MCGGAGLLHCSTQLYMVKLTHCCFEGALAFWSSSFGRLLLLSQNIELGGFTRWCGAKLGFSVVLLHNSDIKIPTAICSKRKLLSSLLKQKRNISLFMTMLFLQSFFSKVELDEIRTRFTLILSSTACFVIFTKSQKFCLWKQPQMNLKTMTNLSEVLLATPPLFHSLPYSGHRPKNEYNDDNVDELDHKTRKTAAPISLIHVHLHTLYKQTHEEGNVIVGS